MRKGFHVRFIVTCLFDRLADELRDCLQLTTIRHGTAVSPIENSLYPVVLCFGFQGDIYCASCFSIGEAHFCLDLFAWIFTENNSRLEEFLFITQSREVTLHSYPLRFVVEVTFQRRVGVYFQRYLEYGRQYLRIVDVQIEVEIVCCFPQLFVWQY